MPTSGDTPSYSHLLLDEQSCSWQERDVPLSERGIRLSWLYNFIDSVLYRDALDDYQRNYKSRMAEYERALAQQKAYLYGPWDNIPWIDATPPREPVLLQLTTRQFVNQYVIRLTEQLQAPLYARVPTSQRGKPTAFLSHAWDAVLLGVPRHSLSLKSYRGTLDAFGQGIAGVQDEFVWIDFVCYNQHKLTEETIAFDMEAIITSIGKVAFAVTPVPLFDRLWCLWELLSVSRAACQTLFCAAPDYRSEKRTTVNDFFNAFTSVTNARASNHEDYGKLLGAMVSRFGSTIAADVYITDLMKRGMRSEWFELYN
jgi:hypothetical protein